MKKLLTTIIIILITLNLFSQSKSINIYDKYLVATITKTDTVINWITVDYSLQIMNNMFVIAESNPKEFYEFLNELIVFYYLNKNDVNKDTEISNVVNNHPVLLSKYVMGIGIVIFDKDGKSYGVFRIKELIIMKEEFTLWCNINKVNYKG